jgi:HSP20 family protein
MTFRRRSTSLLFYSEGESQVRENVLRPPTDLCSTTNGWLIKMELAGVRPEDVSIDIKGSVLHIHGSRRDRTCDEVTGHHNMEIAYQPFYRSVELPQPVTASQVSVDFRDGMMLLRVQYSEEDS